MSTEAPISTARWPVVSDAHRYQAPDLAMPPRLLLGPGPSNVPERVLAATATHPVGYMDRSYLDVMDDVKELLRYVFQTDNEYTISISGTGSAGMETTIANLVEPGDSVVIGIMGYFGMRMAEMVRRYGGKLNTVEVPWGEPIPLEAIEVALKRHRPKVLGLVHGETSTGVRQPLEGVADLCHAHDCLLFVDTVASLGGTPFFTDAWDLDVVYSGSQKVLSAPPGLAPITVSERALAKIRNRPTPVKNWYLDLTLIEKYWNEERKYHHTGPANLNYGLREACRLIAEEGLDDVWARHQAAADRLYAGLAELGIDCYVAPENRLPTLTTVTVPDGVDPKAVSAQLMQDYNIEIANGLGALAGKVWRVGLMGHNARVENVERLLAALREIL